MWTNWDQVSAKLIELACDPRLSTPAECATIIKKVQHTEQLEQWMLAIFTGMAFILVWTAWERIWTKLRPPSEADRPATAEDLLPLLRRGRRHGQ